jgi:hypothetical protein
VTAKVAIFALAGSMNLRRNWRPTRDGIQRPVSSCGA